MLSAVDIISQLRYSLEPLQALNYNNKSWQLDLTKHVGMSVFDK